MQSSARLDKETEVLLTKAAEYTGATKSELVRESILEDCAGIIEKKNGRRGTFIARSIFRVGAVMGKESPGAGRS
jgi:hypothetical protein